MASKKSNRSPKIVALVPMRHNSERVPKKNYRPFAGQPLYRRIVTSLLDCAFISEIVIDTDSPIIRDDVENEFTTVTIIDRPEDLRGDMVPMNDVLRHDVRQVKADFYIQTHSTNPLLRSETISRAIQHFLDNWPTNDSLFSVTRLQVRLWNKLNRAINHDPSVLLRTQDLPPVYEENSCLYIFTRKTLESTNNRIGHRPLMFEIERMEAWDIDEELDFSISEFLFKEHFAPKE